MRERKEKERFIALYKANYGMVSKSCHQMGMETSTYYRWLKEDSDFKSVIEELNMGFVENVEEMVLLKIKDKSDYWILKWLQAHSDKWRQVHDDQEVN